MFNSEMLGDEGAPHLSPNLHLNFQINMSKCKLRSGLGLLDTLQVLADPRSEACGALVREAALQNWRDFEEKEGEPEGHLLSYPIDVFVNIDDDVPVVQLLSRTNNKRFPDSK